MTSLGSLWSAIVAAKAAILTGLAVAALCLPLGYCEGIRHERARQDAARAEANLKAVEGNAKDNEAAAEQRAKDVSTIETAKEEQIDALQGDDAGVRVRAACQRLRASGRSEATLPEQCRAGREEGAAAN